MLILLTFYFQGIKKYHNKHINNVVNSKGNNLLNNHNDIINDYDNNKTIPYLLLHILRS